METPEIRFWHAAQDRSSHPVHFLTCHKGRELIGVWWCGGRGGDLCNFKSAKGKFCCVAANPWKVQHLIVGAAGLGVFSTFILPTTLEDFLGLGIGGVVGYAALLNLPLRRNDAKEKLQRVATNFAEVRIPPPAEHSLLPSCAISQAWKTPVSVCSGS